MSLWQSFADFVLGPVGPEVKSQTVPVHSPEAIEEAYRADLGDDPHRLTRVSTVHACARVIAEGLAQPPCALVQETATGISRAANHPLHTLLSASPNDRQTSYEFREMIGWHLALQGNAYVFVNRGPTGTGQIRELLPLDFGAVTVSVDESRIGSPVQYYIYGTPTPSNLVWHLKGPSLRSWTAMNTVVEAARAIALAGATEAYGLASFKNGAKPAALITPPAETTWTAEQLGQIKASWASSRGAGNSHKTILMTAPIDYHQMSHNASDSQWIEARKFAVTEVCRYFRVSPTKVFHFDGSQSYASVEQAHIAHDQDTDAHWHERFVQSANKALLTPAERSQGYRISIDNRAALRGTAKERMEYYQIGLLNGVLTPNEVREMEGFDRIDSPEADALRPAANLYGDAQPKEGEEPSE